MKTLSLLLLLGLLALSAPAQNYVPMPWTKTNSRPAAAAALMHWPSNGLSVGAVFVDAVAGNDVSGTGAPDYPVASLGRAQVLATNGGSVVAVRGTFSETGLGKTGVRWFFAPGVVVNGPAAGVFTLTQTNSPLIVEGGGTSTNYLLSVDAVTNGQAFVQLGSVTGSSSPAVLFSSTCLSNQIFVGAKTVKIDAAELVNFNTLASNSLNWVSFNARTIQANPATSLTVDAPSATNHIVTATADEFKLSGNAAALTYYKFVLRGGTFSRNGKTVAVMAANWIFQGVTIVSSYADFNSTLYGGVRGNYLIEAP